MKVENLLSLFGTMISLLTAIWMLWRSRKMLPMDMAGGDANAAQVYADAAKKVAEQWTDALERIDQLERQGKTMAESMNALQEVVSQRDRTIDALNQEILQRDRYIAHLMLGIRILIRQLREQKIAPNWEPQDWDQFRE